MKVEHPPLPPPLLGLFNALVARQVPLGVRDYLDALRALRLGFGHGSRKDLRALALALWARSDAERRLIDRWFDHVPPPAAADVAAVDAALGAGGGPGIATDAPGGAGAAGASGVTPAVGRGVGDSDNANGEPAPPADRRARVSFTGPDTGQGLPLPRLLAAPPIGEDYVLDPQPLLRPRDMAVLFRRHRRATRSGPRTELDIDATVRERCRSGLLLAPAYRPRRCNSTRLLVLADASPSMAPWQPFMATLADSLPLGRFAQVGMHWFDNLPRRTLHTGPALDAAEPRDAVLRRFAGASLLVIGDAGSARGHLNRRRAVQTGVFLAEAALLFRAIVWLNPMPRARWPGTTAELVAADRHATTLALSAVNMLRAIDILRGIK